MFPRHLSIVMRVNVYETGRDQQSARINLVPSARGYLANSSNRLAVDGDIRNVRFCTASIGDEAATND